VNLTTTQRKQAYAILLDGVKLLKKWAVFYPGKKFRFFRNAVMSGDKNPKKKTVCSLCSNKEPVKFSCCHCDGTGFILMQAIPSDKLSEFESDLPTILKIRQINPVFRFKKRDRTAEEALLESYAALAKFYAKRWTIEENPSGLSFADYLQEAYMTILEAIWQWDKPERADLTTFVWYSIRNRFSAVTNRGNLLCPYTNEDLKLVVQFEKGLATINGPSTFEETIKKLNMTEEEGKYLLSIMTKVYSENQFSRGDKENESSPHSIGNDYTMCRKGIDNEKSVDTLAEQERVDRIIAQANLTPLEKKVFEQAMEPFYGWQTEFAKENINPESGKPYTRARIGQILKNAQMKLEKVVEKAA
jgi:DNA-directed RNA polymerase specialized sigma subunit